MRTFEDAREYWRRQANSIQHVLDWVVNVNAHLTTSEEPVLNSLKNLQNDHPFTINEIPFVDLNYHALDAERLIRIILQFWATKLFKKMFKNEYFNKFGRL